MRLARLRCKTIARPALLGLLLGLLLGEPLLCVLHCHLERRAAATSAGHQHAAAHHASHLRATGAGAAAHLPATSSGFALAPPSESCHVIPPALRQMLLPSLLALAASALVRAGPRPVLRRLLVWRDSPPYPPPRPLPRLSAARWVVA